jgi:Glucodextranase, domain B
MAGGILILGWFCLLIGLGVVGPAVSSLVQSFGEMVGSMTHITGSPSPSASGVASDAPVIQPPDQATTNVASVDLTVLLPPTVVGLDGYSCRLYVTLPNAQPAVIAEAPVKGASTLVFSSLTLVKGLNTFTATIAAGNVESAASKAVTVTLDVAKPKITISSPKNGAAVKGTSVTVKGKTQPSSEVQIKNDANNATATTTADDTGLFSAAITVAAGPNTLTVTVSDPAGNGNTAKVTVTRGSGTLGVTLSSTVYQFSRKHLPANVTFTAVVVGADGKPVAGATALFTVSVPGIPALVSPTMTTDRNGKASFSATIPKGAMAGAGVGDVLITMPNGAQTTTDRVSLKVQ